MSTGTPDVTSTTAHKKFKRLQSKKIITSLTEEIQIELVSVTRELNSIHWYGKSGADNEVTQFSKMESYYSRQTVLPRFSGPSNQRGSGFGSVAAGVGRVALLFAKNVLLPAMKKIGEE